MSAIATPVREAQPPRVLSAEERRAYDAEGFVVVPGGEDAGELDAMDQEIDRLLAAPGNDAGGIHPTWIFQVARRSELARRFAEDERLLSLIENSCGRASPSTPPSSSPSRRARTTSATGTRTTRTTSSPATRTPTARRG